jgi:hypothetical protein
VAVIVRPDTLRIRRARAAIAVADEIDQLLQTGRRTPLDEPPALSLDRAEELIGDIRHGRDRGST